MRKRGHLAEHYLFGTNLTDFDMIWYLNGGSI